jgi:hypothetical protein
MAYGSRSDPTRSGIISASCHGRTVHNVFIYCEDQNGERRHRPKACGLGSLGRGRGGSKALATTWAEHKKNGNEHGDAKRPVTRGQDDHLVHDEESIVVNKPDAAGARAGCVQRRSAAHA